MKYFLSFLAVIASVLLAHTALADSPFPIQAGNLLPGQDIHELVNGSASTAFSWFQTQYLVFALKILIGFTATSSVIMIVFGGYQYIVHAGGEKASGKGTIIAAVVGLLITFFAYGAVQIILSIDLGTSRNQAVSEGAATAISAPTSPQ